MIYDDAVDQVKGLTKTTESILKLAEVTSVRTDGRAMVKFYGDALESSKVYPYIAGYKPTVGDIVLLMGQATTYIIIGKLSKEQIGNAYYMTKAMADLTYLTENTADGKYMPINGTVDKLVSGTNEVQLATKTLTPKTTEEYSIGSSSKKFKDAYINEINAEDVKATALYGGWRYTASGSEIVSWEDKLRLRPNNHGTVYLGTSGKKFLEVNGVTGVFDVIKGHWGYSSARYLAWNSSGNTIVPSNNDTINIGTGANSQLNNVYAKQFYQNGIAISTSDKRKKKNIKDITKDYVEFFKKLRPRLFKFKNGESGRLHMGFIAQESEAAADESGIELEDLAFICKDDEGNYGLRYDELIALQTKVIQDLLKRVETLERRNK